MPADPHRESSFPQWANRLESVWLAPPPPPPRRKLGHVLVAVLRGLASLLGMLIVLVGLPAGLVYLVGWPLPSWDEITRYLNDSSAPATLTMGGFIRLVACVLWLGWAALVIVFIAEIVASIMRIRLPRLRLAVPGQQAVTALLGGLMLAIASIRAAAAPAAGSVAVAPAAGAPQLPPGEDAADPPPPPQTTPGMEPVGQVTVIVAGQRYTHTVAKGDTLWHIAQAWLGDPNRWPEIYALNRGRRWPTVGGSLHDPDLIYPGWVLDLPADAIPPAGAAPARPDTTTAGQGAPARDTATTPSSGTPAATRTAGVSPPAATAPPAASSGSTHSPHPTEGTSEAGTDRDAGEEPLQSPGRTGVRLPSQGWVSLGLATTIAVVAALLRLQRRRRARLTYPIPTPTGPVSSPVPDTLRAADAAGSRQLAFRSDGPLAGLAPAPPPVAAPIGVDANGVEISLFDLPGPGIALDGEGAPAAARAILAAALATGATGYLSDRPVVLTTAGTLAGLLPAGTTLAGLDPDGVTFDGERLFVLADVASAVTRLEEEMIHRRRVLDTVGADSVAALNAGDDHAEALPPYVLLVPAEPRYTGRVLAVAAHRASLDIHIVLVGGCPGMPTYHLALDGTVTSVSEVDDADQAGGGRLSTLAARDLADTLAMLAVVAARAESGEEAGDPAPPPAIGKGPPAPAFAAGESSVDALAEIPTLPEVAPVRLHVLGPVILSTDAGVVTSGMRSGSYAVLALLAARPGGCGLDELVVQVYPDAEPGGARRSIHSAINAARTVLRKATGLAGAMFIAYDGQRYRLDPELVDVDLWRMLGAINRANAAVDDEPECLAALRQAAECYGGDFAASADIVDAVDYATTFRHQILSVYGRIAELLELDQPDEAIAALEAAAEHDPLNEELYQRIMRIHGRLGRTDAVRRTLRLLEQRLFEVGQAEVSEATRRVANRQLALRRPGDHDGHSL